MPSTWLRDAQDKENMINDYHVDYDALESGMQKLKNIYDRISNDKTDIDNSSLFTTQEKTDLATEINAIKNKIKTYVDTW